MSARPVAIVIIATLAALWPVVTNRFTSWDDQFTILANPHVHPPTVGGLVYLWTHPYKELWIPLTYTVWIGLAAVAPQNSWVFHGANLLLHACAAVAVFFLLRRLRFDDIAAMFAALIFALHPIQVEAVAWAAGLKDVLAGLLAIVALERYAAADSRIRSGAYALALIAFVGAMLAKPSAVVVPLIAWLIDVMLMRRDPRRALRAAAPMLALAVPIVIIAKFAQPASLITPAPLWWRPIIAGDALAFYILKLVWPANLAIDYGRSPAHVMSSALALSSCLAPAAGGLLAILAWRKDYRIGPAGAAIFVAALLPVLGFVPFEFQDKSTVADHYLYLPMLGVAIAVAGFLRSPRARWRIVIATMLIVSLAILAHRQTRVWRDNYSLFRHVVAVNPNSIHAWNNLFVQAMDDGDGAAAEVYARRMLAIDANDPLATINLAGALAVQQRFDDAASLYREATLRWPDRADAHVGLGLVLLDLHRWREALEEFQTAQRLAPDRSDLAALLARARASAPTQP